MYLYSLNYENKGEINFKLYYCGQKLNVKLIHSLVDQLIVARDEEKYYSNIFKNILFNTYVSIAVFHHT